ncbi:MAG: homoserine kinase [Terriglobales bacterium]
MAPSSKKNRRQPKTLELILPATSANLGPAFDAAALALELFIRVRARTADEFSIVASGRDLEICEKLENHLILSTYREVLQAARKSVQPLALKIENHIPIGKGCGSSAAARLAGIALAVYFAGLRWTDIQIVDEASRREHHPDNASACWMGGLTVANMTVASAADLATAKVTRIVPKVRWPLLLAVPAESLSTSSAREVLPGRYSRSDVVTNIQNAMMLLAAFTQGRPDLLSSALKDRIHQPYRAALCPLLPALEDLPKESGALGVALSGAGPSVIIFLDSKMNVSRTKARVRDHLSKRGLFPELIITEISKRGVSGSWKKTHQK